MHKLNSNEIKVDLINYCAILLLENEGNYSPSQEEIEQIETLIRLQCQITKFINIPRYD